MKKLFVLLVVGVFAGAASAGVDLTGATVTTDLPATVPQGAAVDLEFDVTVANIGDTNDVNVVDVVLMYSPVDLDDAGWNAYFTAADANFIADTNSVSEPNDGNDVIVSVGYTDAGTLEVGTYYFRVKVDPIDDVNEDNELNNLSAEFVLTVREHAPESTILIYSLAATVRSMEIADANVTRLANERINAFIVVDTGQLYTFDELGGNTFIGNTDWVTNALVYCKGREPNGVIFREFFDTNDPNANLYFAAIFNDPNDPAKRKMQAAFEFEFTGPDFEDFWSLTLCSGVRNVNLFWDADADPNDPTRLAALAATSLRGVGDCWVGDATLESIGVSTNVGVKLNTRFTRLANDPDNEFFSATVDEAIANLKQYLIDNGYEEISYE